LIKNTKFNFLKNFKIFPMDEIPKHNKLKKDLNFKISNMNMNIIIQFTKVKGSISNSSWIDSSKLDSYTLPTFTKKIFIYLEKNK
jgi:A/G-specific adenine glycosylase